MILIRVTDQRYASVPVATLSRKERVLNATRSHVLRRVVGPAASKSRSILVAVGK